LWGWNLRVGVLADLRCNISLVVHVACYVILYHFVATHTFTLLEEKGPVVLRAWNALSFNKAFLRITIFTGWNFHIISHIHHPVAAWNIKSGHSRCWQRKWNVEIVAVLEETINVNFVDINVSLVFLVLSTDGNVELVIFVSGQPTMLTKKW